MKNILTRLFRNEELSISEAKEILIKITEGAYPDAQIASLLTVFQMRGITVNEMIGFKEGLQSTQKPLNLEEYHPIDIVGTGGDGKNTFNISTCACFVVAGAGYNVVKHGNYGATSVSGASNVIENHGVKFTSDESKIRESIDKCGFAYLHAPLFTPAMKSVAPVRKSMSVRTIFNMLGPLINPARPQGQLLGVADLSLMRLYTNVFQKLGIGFAVVTSVDGYDEISLTGEFKVSATNYDRVYQPYELNMQLVAPKDIYGGETQSDATKIFDNVLTNKGNRAQRECVLVNAAFAIQTINPNKDIMSCINEAKESLISGKAYSVLEKFIAINS